MIQQHSDIFQTGQCETNSRKHLSMQKYRPLSKNQNVLIYTKSPVLEQKGTKPIYRIIEQHTTFSVPTSLNLMLSPNLEERLFACTLFFLYFYRTPTGLMPITFVFPK